MEYKSWIRHDSTHERCVFVSRKEIIVSKCCCTVSVFLTVCLQGNAVYIRGPLAKEGGLVGKR